METQSWPQADLYLVAAVLEAAKVEEIPVHLRALADEDWAPETPISLYLLNEVCWLYEVFSVAVTTEGPQGRKQMEELAARGQLVLAELKPPMGQAGPAWCHLHLHSNGVLHGSRMASSKGWLCCSPARNLPMTGQYLLLSYNGPQHQYEAPLIEG
jgi:hypothetical protein